MNRRWAPRVALVAGGSAIALLALWLRNPVLPYGGEGPAASGRNGTASIEEARAYENRVRSEALSALRKSLAEEQARLAHDAARALDTPTPMDEAFAHLSRLRPRPEEGIVVFEEGVPFAWAGQITVDPSTASANLSASISPFYTTVSAVAQRGTRKAVATAVVHDEAPADRIAKSLDAELAERHQIQPYDFAAGNDTTGGEAVLYANHEVLLRADATPLPREQARFSRAARVREWGTVFLCSALLILLAVAWRDRKLLGERVASVAVSLAAIALVPWSSFSNTARAFDPTYYYSALGGPFTANAGVLTMAAALALMSVFAIIRSRRVRVPRWLGWPGALVFGIAGPFIAVSIAPGIGYPSWGTTAGLWLTWETPFFLLVFASWLAAAALARVALGRRGTIHLGAAAAIALLAGTAASVIVWRVTTAKRLELASQDIVRLQRPDREAAALLRRFGSELTRYDSAGGRADLLKRYAVSDLAAADLPISLATWTDQGLRSSELTLAPVAYDSDAVTRTVLAARDSAQPVIVQTLGANGREIVMATHHARSGFTTAVVSPRTLLLAPDPFVSLLGFSPPVRADPPYTLTISDVTPNAGVRADTMQWRRIGDEMHGDRLVQTSRGVMRAHAEVDLRSVSARSERLVLIVIFDAAIAGFLWALGAIAEGGFLRWVRARSGKWIRSYRGRLTLALSAFFAIPALVFALWSYQRLRNDDREVRELLVRETLDAVVTEADSGSVKGVVRPYNTPLFLYSSGLLSAVSDSLLDELGSSGRALPVPVYQSIAGHGELNASWQQPVGKSDVLFGYRAAAGPSQERYVLAAPARSDELTLDRRRRDLTILVLFATVIGALAALWLSGFAAKRLARDLELSRIEVARAERILAWGEMARQVAHEIKNPLTPIRLGVQHLKRARTDPRVNFDRVLDENVERILSEIDRLDEIARAFSRYGSAPADLPPPESIDVAAILRDVVALERMGVGDVSWTLSGAKTAVLAEARPDELRDVLLNVFENARLARARKVDVRLTHAPRTVTIEIEDNGSGIDQSALPRVFEPQFSTRTTGSGLGLAISRRLLESWGGTIEITSEKGRGSRVVLTLQTAL